MSLIEHHVCEWIGKEREGARRSKFIPPVGLIATSPVAIRGFKNPPATKRKKGIKLAECTSISVFTPFGHGWVGTHGGGWGKAKRDKCDKSGALQGGDCASSGIAFLGPSRAPFRILSKFTC